MKTWFAFFHGVTINTPTRAVRGWSHGFTILEVMVVLVIIGLIMGLVGPQLFNQLERSKAQTAETQTKLLQTALETFYLDLRRYPQTDEGLTVLRRPPGGDDAALWNGPYLREEVPKDPWGNPYVYQAGNSRDAPFFLFSYGADGRAGGEGPDADVGRLPPRSG